MADFNYMSLLDKIFGDPNAKIIKTLEPTISQINALEEKMKSLNEVELRALVVSFKEKLAGKKWEEQKVILDEILPEAFAVIREASSRVLGQRHYDVQLIGGIILHRGQIAEMRTGEGKTLVATLPLFLNALASRGVHLVTVNDYLSKVGAGWMAPVFDLLGLSSSVIVHDAAFIYDRNHVDDTQFDERLQHFKKISRQEAYACDVTYGTNNEFGFDYLRDNMVPSLSAAVQRPLHYSIVDEIDSILIDEARTPLIISGAIDEKTDKYYKFSELVERLEENEDYNVDEKMRAATLTENGIAKVEKILGLGNIYVEGGVREVHHLEQALKARVLFKRDKDYVVKDGEIIIVDEFTGRMMPGRRYSEGLHQAIEAKEGVKVQKESRTMATITFQNLFRMYEKLSGMTGTAVTEAEEFHKIYNLETIVIPTNRPNIRRDGNDLIYRTEMDKFQAVIRDIKERSQKGQPVLVGTISIEKNEILAEMMEREGLRPQMLNAKNHQKEAEIIAQAGRPGAVTLATNMAGRGVDIILGGNPPIAEEQEKVKECGGLHVIGTERHESRRIDNQLRGRAGRQGDPGSSQFYVSTEDDLMRIFGGDRMKNLMKTLNVPADMPIQNKMISNSIESAQKKVEGNNFDIRKHLVEYDDVINKHRTAIYKRRREIIEIAERTNRVIAEKSVEAIAEDSKEETGEAVIPRNQAVGGTEAGMSEEEKKNKTLSEIILAMIQGEIFSVVNFHTAAENLADWNLKEINETIRTIWPAGDEILAKLKELAAADKNKEITREEIIVYLNAEAEARYKVLAEGFKNVNLKFPEVEKGILIRSIDEMWVEHLETIDYLRRGIGLRGYGQRDPLVEYKKEAYQMYQELNGLIQKQVAYSIFKTGDALMMAAEAEAKKFAAAPAAKLEFSGAAKEMQKQAGTRNSLNFVHEKVKDESGEKVGRNDPCPCGSGLKYKKCCGK
jgi:preprotein translocase subunit SecA